jgi:hypothetical protein
MLRFGRTAMLVGTAMLAACVEPPRPVRLPAPAFATTPDPPPRPPTLSERIRSEAWLTRFWEELTPAQRRRVTARLRRADPPLVSDAAAAPVWDAMGLPDRDALVFGPARR